MRRLPPLVFVLTALTLQLAAQSADPETPPSEARVAELRRLLTRDPGASWLTIPWQTDLLAAQRSAAESHRPLFVWAMDGHPLGCT